MQTDDSAELFQQLTRRIEADMQHYHIPGVAVGVISGDNTFAAGFGVTSVDNPLPVTADTLFQIGSITKTITATAAMRLVERGVLDLDAPLRAYLPGLRLSDPDVLERVTLRHVFSHTAGWLGDYFDDLGPGDDALARIVARMIDLPQETPLGEIWSYNNAGFYLAGRILEVITGLTYEAAARDLVLEPLGMQHSFFFPADIMTYRFVVGHDAVYPGEARSPRVLRPWAVARTLHAVGGLAAPVTDLLRYARFQMGDGRTEDGQPLLSAERLAEMHHPAVAAGGGEFMGVSWFNQQRGDLTFLRHGGATKGQMATLRVVPARRFALVVLTNSDRGSELYQPLARWAFAHYLDSTENEPLPIPVEPQQLDEYAGHYTAAADDLFLDVQMGELVLRDIPKGGFPSKDSPPPPPPPPVHVALCGPDRIVVMEEPGRGDLGEFLRTPTGQVAWLRFGGRVHRRVT